jgi:hypothetical protein
MNSSRSVEIWVFAGISTFMCTENMAVPYPSGGPGNSTLSFPGY